MQDPVIANAAGPSRRTVLQAAAVGSAGLTPALRAAVYAAGCYAPEK